MATWTTPTTRTSGDLITASNWNTDLTENLKYLKDAPTFDGSPVVGSGSATRTLTVKGTASGTGGGAQVVVQNTTTDVLNLGNESQILGTAYSAVGYVYGGSGLKFGTSGATQLAIDTAGLLTLTAGQIKFPATQNASTDVNTLDDYEEGTWTPILGGQGGQSGQTYDFQFGRYIKIGKLVKASFYIDLSAKGTITGTAMVGGLPFTVATGARGDEGAGCVSYWLSLATNWTYVSCDPVSNSTYAVLQGTTAAAASTTLLTTTDIGNATRIEGTMVYQATA